MIIIIITIIATYHSCYHQKTDYRDLIICIIIILLTFFIDIGGEGVDR